MALDDKLEGVNDACKDDFVRREDTIQKLDELIHDYQQLRKDIAYLRTMDLPADPAGRQEFQRRLDRALEVAKDMGNELTLYVGRSKELLEAGPLAAHAILASISYRGLTTDELRSAGLPPAKLSGCTISFDHSGARYEARYDTTRRLLLSPIGHDSTPGLADVAAVVQLRYGGQPFPPPWHEQDRLVTDKTLGAAHAPDRLAAAVDSVYARHFSNVSIDELRYANITRDELVSANLPPNKVSAYRVG
jgi:hypothetical protein